MEKNISILIFEFIKHTPFQFKDLGVKKIYKDLGVRLAILLRFLVVPSMTEAFGVPTSVGSSLELVSK